MRKLFTFLILLIISTMGVQGQYINEFHYDNGIPSGDVGEFVEVFFPDPQPPTLTEWIITLYNGSSSSTNQYNSTSLMATTQTCVPADGGCYYVWMVAGIQNGSPDGIALSGPSFLEFLSYEGTFTAGDGPAMGTLSIDVGVAEGSSTLAGESLQRNSMGVWEGPLPETPGAKNQNALPIELSSFTASKKSKEVALNWTTVSESNNDYFIVEHSGNGSDFRTIGEVAGAGTTEEISNYSFNHNAPVKGLNYYRLRQVDYSREISVSEVEVVEWDLTGTLEIFPSLIEDHATVALGDGNEDKDILVHDISGRLILQWNTNDSGTIDLNFSNISSGTYFVTLSSFSTVQTAKVVKL